MSDVRWVHKDGRNGVHGLRMRSQRISGPLLIDVGPRVWVDLPKGRESSDTTLILCFPIEILLLWLVQAPLEGSVRSSEQIQHTGTALDGSTSMMLRC
jgi:hypothetical protein